MKKEFEVKDSGKRIDYPSGMRRDVQTGKTNYRLIDLDFLKRLADHLVKGAEKYGRDNWRKANSQEELDRFLDSGLRHFMQYLAGDTDEDHMAAVCFNLMAAEHVKGKLEISKNSDPAKDEADIWKLLGEIAQSMCKVFKTMVQDGPVVTYTTGKHTITFNFYWTSYQSRYCVTKEELLRVKDIMMMTESIAESVSEEYKLHRWDWLLPKFEK